MISIVICSINRDLFNQVSQSIADTIGVDYEIIRIDNTVVHMGICEAYNRGASEAKFPYVCFLHEDILIKSANWGAEIISFFETNSQVGLVGVAGSAFKSQFPSIWAQALFQTDHINVIQHYRNNVVLESNGVPGSFVEVKTLDGVCLFTTKEVLKKNSFDSLNFDRFHCYDLDFCLQVGQHSRLFVYHGLLIEHFSSGSLNKDWVNYSIKVSEKWKDILPIGDIPDSHKKAIEWRNRKVFFFRMNILGYPFGATIRIFLRFGFLKNTSFIDLAKFIYQMIGQKLKLLPKKPFY